MYSTNGRIKPVDKEVASTEDKKLFCVDCGYRAKATAKHFGEERKCPTCGTVLELVDHINE